jgi:hypothetical protein
MTHVIQTIWAFLFPAAHAAQKSAMEQAHNPAMADLELLTLTRTDLHPFARAGNLAMAEIEKAKGAKP